LLKCSDKKDYNFYLAFSITEGKRRPFQLAIKEADLKIIKALIKVPQEK
jgi:hypothetical protein